MSQLAGFYYAQGPKRADASTTTPIKTKGNKKLGTNTKKPKKNKSNMKKKGN
jgi:hypothetical protein